MATYALVVQTTVQNVIVADQDFIDSISSNYDVVVDVSYFDVQPNIGWQYSSGTFSDPTQTLANAKAQKLADYKAAIQTYVDCAFDQNTRMQFMNLYVLAQFDGLTNRAAYLRPMLDWTNSIISYSATVAASVMALTNIDDVKDYVWNIPAHVNATPTITLAAAVQISN